VDRFQKEQSLLRALPRSHFDTDELVSAKVNSHARIRFDSNRYSVPPKLARKTVLVRADPSHIRVFHQGAEVACHPRCFERQQLICQEAHLLEAKTLRRRQAKTAVEEEFDRLGDAARIFHLNLLSRPLKPQVHLRRLIKLAQLYGREDVLVAIEQANQYETYDAQYVEAILHQQRRQRELPSPTEIRPIRSEWLDETDYETPDPAHYDQFFEDHNDDLPN
jgi:hypothetical protein